MRLLVVANRQAAGDQTGFPQALDALKQAGTLAAWSVLTPSDDPRGARVALDELPERAREFEPDAVVFLKPEGWGLADGDVAALRSAIGQRPLLGVANLDAYSRFRKPLGPESRVLLPACEVAWTSGGGRFPGVFRRLGARRVRYQWLGIDQGRFGAHPAPVAAPDFDVVVIANLHRSLRAFDIPTPRLPGVAGRVLLVRALERRFGRRFGVFGAGWTGPCAQGPLPYVEQHRVLARSRVAANWDYFPREPYYFSDRTPVFMASGTPFVTTWHPGYEALFQGGNGLTWGRDVSGVIAGVEALLERSDAERAAIGARARSFALEHFTLERMFGRFVADLESLAEGRPLVGLGLPGEGQEGA